MKTYKRIIIWLPLLLVLGTISVIAQPTPHEIIQQAKELIDAERTSEALELLDQSRSTYPEAGDRFLFQKAWILFTRSRDFNGAVTAFTDVAREYPTSSLGDDALYYAGFIAQHHLGDFELASKLYKEGYDVYPDGDFRHSLADKLAGLEGMQGTSASDMVIEGISVQPVIARRPPPSTDIFETSPRRPGGSRTVTIQFDQAPLRTFIRWVADVTGRNFIVDDAVSGNVTVFSGRPIEIEEVYRVFLSILAVKGFAAVDAGDLTKIIPRGVASHSELPIILDDDVYMPTDRVVTRIFRLKYTSAASVQGLIRPLLPPSDQVIINPSTNTVIVTGSGNNIARVAELIRIVDESREAVTVRSYRIRFGQAVAVAGKISSLVTTFVPPGATPPPFQIIADERTNTVHVVAPPELHERVALLIAEFDFDKSGERLVQVFQLEYARADEAAVQLRQLLGLESPEAAPDAAGATQTILIADPRLNAISVSTYAPRIIDLVSSYISKIDRAPQQDVRNTKVFKLQNAQADELFDLLTQIYGDASTPEGAFALGLADQVKIAPDPRTNSLIITATTADWNKLQNLIGQLDVRKSQVLVDAVILETSLGEARSLGFNLSTTDPPTPGKTRIIGGSILVPPDQFSKGGLLVTAVQGSTIGSALQALLTSSKTNVLQMPQVLALDNEEAYIQVGDLTPIVSSRSVSSDNVQIGGNSSIFQNVEYRNIGLNLRLTPHIGESGDILMDLSLEVQNRAASGELGLPIFTNRSLESKIQVRDGDYVVLGGLLRSQDTWQKRETPWLTRIPFFGVLFQNTNSSEDKTVLLIFLRPRIVTHSDRLLDITEEERLQFDAESKLKPGSRRSELEKWLPEGL